MLWARENFNRFLIWIVQHAKFHFKNMADSVRALHWQQRFGLRKIMSPSEGLRWLWRSNTPDTLKLFHRHKQRGSAGRVSRIQN